METNSPSTSEPLELVGTLTRWIFQTKSKDFAVAEFQQINHSVITIYGELEKFSVGKTLKLYGDWQIHHKYGKRFRVIHGSEDFPITANAIESYLSSGKINGIGATLAKRIISRFGNETIDILDHNIERLQEVSGIGESKLTQIKKAWWKEQEKHRALITLQSHGLLKGQAVKILKKYGDNALEIVKFHTYQILGEIAGIGFKGVDEIALQQNIQPSNPMRSRCAILHVLKEALQSGHCLLPESHVIEGTDKLLLRDDYQADHNDLRLQIQMMVATRQLRQEESRRNPGNWCYYLPEIHKNEGEIAAALEKITSQPTMPVAADFSHWLLLYSQIHEIALSTAQQEAIESAVSNQVTIITGGPGTGKTLITRVILAWWKQQGYKTILAAPTGRAAQRLSDVTEHDASTLHRILEYESTNNSFQRNREHPLKADAVIVDESSMADLFLANGLLQAIPDECQLLIIGDVDQLSSVGPGAVLRDLISCQQIPTVRLTEVFRQAQTSAIIQHAYKINQGHTPAIERWNAAPKSQCLWVEASSAEVGVQEIFKVLRDPQFPKSQDVQIITPSVKHEIGTKALNPLLQNLINPEHPEKPIIVAGGRTFRLGDRVVQRQNNYVRMVFNGELGYIINIDVEDAEVTVEFNAQIATYHHKDLSELDLAYAITGHKAQGCEFPVIVVPLFMQAAQIINRQWLYTTLTRAKKLVVIVGETRALNFTIRQPRTKPRFTLLAERIKEAFNPPSVSE